jgi:hypothetical protein
MHSLLVWVFTGLGIVIGATLIAWLMNWGR